MILGAEPLMADDRTREVFEATDKLMQRLLVEVAYNPNYQDTAMCQKAEITKFYNTEWKPYADLWRRSLWESFERADDTALNGLAGRVNGLAKNCLVGFKNSDQVKGLDADEQHAVAAWVDINAPGGRPPPGGGLKPATKVLLGIGGLVVVSAALALKAL